MAKERDIYPDIIRIFAYCCVVLLHSLTPVITDAGLYGSFSWYFTIAANAVARAGVPLFLMLSGHLLLGREERPLAFYRRRFPRILVPLLAWNVVYFLSSVGRGEASPTVDAFLAVLLDNGSAYHLWYLYTLAGLYLLLPFFSVICRNCTRGELFALLLVTLFPGTIRPFLNTHLPVYLYLFGVLVEGYLGYVLLGYLLGRMELTRTAVLAACACVALGIWMSVTGNAAASSAEGIALPANGGYMLHHYLCAGGMFVLLRRIFEGRDASPKARRALSTLSGATFPAYGVHVLILNALQESPPAPPITLWVIGSAALTAAAGLAFGFLVRTFRATRVIFG